MPVPPALLEPTAAPTYAATPTAATPTASAATGPILVATAGDPDTDAALRLAWRLAGRTGADVQVLTACEPFAPIDVGFTVMPPLPGELLAAERDGQLAQVRAQLRRTAPAGCDWPVAAADGPADGVIARVARDEDARVVVLGRGRHGVAGRLAGGERVLRLLRLSDCPVYAVEPDVTTLARRVVVAMDFSPYSVHAARVALGLVAPDATVTLAHVWPSVPATAPVGWARTYARALPGLFARVRTELAAPESVLLETVTLSGRSAGRAVADFAAATHADLVVSATHGHGYLARLVLGSVATELLRRAPCSFLCVPGSAVAHAAARDAARARLLHDSVPSDGWEDALQRLSRRWAGRPCTLAVTDARTGAPVEVGPMPLAAITYAADTRTVQLLCGTPGVGPPHLTYVAHDVTAVDRFVDADGRDRALRVSGADGDVHVRLL